jgi:hypothetical protein
MPELDSLEVAFKLFCILDAVPLFVDLLDDDLGVTESQ